MTTLDATLATHRAVVERFAEHLGRASDGSRPIPHLTWTVSDLGAHVLAGLRAYARAVSDEVPMWADSQDGGSANQAHIDATPEREPAEIAAAIPAALEELHRLVPGREGTVPAWGDIRLTPGDLVAMHIGDVAVHGWDLSRATGERWVIERDEALISGEAIFGIAHHFVDVEAAAGLHATYGVTIRGGPSFGLRFDDGALQVTPGRPERADCRISNDPVAFMLLGYKRIGLLRPALTGKAVAYGRKPWLALRFLDLLAAP